LSAAIGSLGNVGASRHQRFKGFGVIEEQAVIDHTCIVFAERFQRFAGRHEAQASIDRRCLALPPVVASPACEDRACFADDRDMRLRGTACRFTVAAQDGSSDCVVFLP